MDNKETKKALEEILEKMGISWSEILVSENKDGTARFSIKTDESNILIGDKGSGLLSLNSLVKKIVEKKDAALPQPEYDSRTGAGEKPPQFSIDVNDYQEKKTEELKNKALVLAERARSFKTEVEMDPMSSYERMIVHSFFAETPDIKTESKGEGRDRRVVIKFKES
ncbi:MAG: R3H domain-containing nucleic acid-binding protein [Patescibacteria group bacterium]